MQNEADQELYCQCLCIQNTINVHICALMNQLGVRKEISGDMIMPSKKMGVEHMMSFGLLGGGRAVAVAEEVTTQRNLMIQKLQKDYTMPCKGKKKGKGSKK